MPLAQGQLAPRVAGAGNKALLLLTLLLVSVVTLGVAVAQVAVMLQLAGSESGKDSGFEFERNGSGFDSVVAVADKTGSERGMDLNSGSDSHSGSGLATKQKNRWHLMGSKSSSRQVVAGTAAAIMFDSTLKSAPLLGLTNWG